MTRLLVNTAARTLASPAGVFSCTIGRCGACAASEKREGDGHTPLGAWPIRGALFRRDRFVAPSNFALPWRWIAREDGWSDDPADPVYNRPITHPHTFSAERLWRRDGAYDAVLVLGHNDRPPVPGRGSAIFLHLTNGSGATEGCVAVSRADMERLLRGLRPGDAVLIR